MYYFLSTTISINHFLTVKWMFLSNTWLCCVYLICVVAYLAYLTCIPSIIVLCFWCVSESDIQTTVFSFHLCGLYSFLIRCRLYRKQSSSTEKAHKLSDVKLCTNWAHSRLTISGPVRTAFVTTSLALTAGLRM